MQFIADRTVLRFQELARFCFAFCHIFAYLHTDSCASETRFRARCTASGWEGHGLKGWGEVSGAAGRGARGTYLGAGRASPRLCRYWLWVQVWPARRLLPTLQHHPLILETASVRPAGILTTSHESHLLFCCRRGSHPATYYGPCMASKLPLGGCTTLL